MGGPVLGIDLGTTNSVVAVADGKRVRVLSRSDGGHLIPSVVSFLPDGGVAVGEEGRERRLFDPLNTIYSVKRLIGRPYYSPEVHRAQQRFAFDLVERSSGGVGVSVRGEIYTLTEISAFVLRELRRVAEEVLGESCERAVITVPANFNELQRSATKAAAKVAGLEVARIINEPTAAALAYGYRDRPERVAVYDFGGGTFDITVLELEDDVFEVVSTAGDTFLGGDDIDHAIGEAMAEQFQQSHGGGPIEDREAWERLRAAGEWVKINLSLEQAVEVKLEELAADAAGNVQDLQFRMTREELEQRVQPIVARSFEVCGQALRQAGMEAGELDSVILVGGSTRMPLVRRMVSEHFGREPQTGIDPDLVVAQGAAIHGRTLAGKKPESNRKSRDSIPALSSSKPPQPQATPDATRQAHGAVPEAPKVPQEAKQEAKQEAPQQTEPQADPQEQPLSEQEAAGLPPVLGGLFGDPDPESSEPEQSPAAGGAEPQPVTGAASSEAGMPLSVNDTMEFELDLDVPSEGAEPVSLDSGGGSAVQIDPQYAEQADSLAPGVLRRYNDQGAGEIEIDVEPEQAQGLPEPRTTETSFAGELELSDLEPVESAQPPPPPPEASKPVVEMPDKPAPLLMDVTPQSLGLETAGGWCQHLIARNAPIPAEQTRMFTTARDGQQAVTVRVCQGEAREFEANQLLGEVELSELRQAPRGQVRIQVSFILDANGTLDVKATDVTTGREQTTRINLLGGLSSEEIEEMRARQQKVLGKHAAG